MSQSTSDFTLEPGLFVIWKNGRPFQNQILDYLAANFHITRVAEFHWTPAMVWANYQRFYSDIRLRGSAHARNKGTGPFLAISVIVKSPTYASRQSQYRGSRVVNTKMFDAKTHFRELTCRYGIHCGETLAENLRDTCMLYGPGSEHWVRRESPKWDGAIEFIEQDPVGAHGWRSFDELFSVLNRTVDYALLYYGPTEATMDGLLGGVSFDILTSNYYAAHAILHSGPRIPEPPKYGGEIEIRVADKPVRLNLRYSGDGQFNKNWATSILHERVLDPRGFHRPKEEELYWLMAHRVVAQGAQINRKLLRELMSTAADQHMVKSSNLPTDETDVERLLTSQLVQRGLLRPMSNSRLGRVIDIAMSGIEHRYQILAARLRTLYFAARDSILAHFPILSSIKTAIFRHTGIGKAS